MELDRNKIFKLTIVLLCTLAALAVMSTLVQLIQTILPFLIVGGGVFVAYRWAFTDAPPPTADEVEEQARGWFKRFRRGKKAVETTMAASAALDEVSEKVAPAAKPRDRRAERRRARQQQRSQNETKTEAPTVDADADAEKLRQAKIAGMKKALDDGQGGEISFKDSDVVISKGDIVKPDIKRLEEKEKEAPTVNDAVLRQIAERQRRLQQ